MSEAPELNEDRQPKPQLVPKPADYASLYAKIAAVMGDVQRVEKRANVGGKYDVATSDDLLDMLRPIMAKHNLVCIPNMVRIETERFGDKGGHVMTGHFEFTVAEGNSGMSITRPWQATVIGYDDKTTQKVSRIATRYFLTNLFQLSTGDTTDDGDLDSKSQDTPFHSGQRVETPLNASAHRKMDDSNGATTSRTSAPRVEHFFTDPEFDYTEFWKAIKPLFKNDHHRTNAINKMFDEGILSTDFTTEQAIRVVKEAREKRETEPAGEGDDADD